jgi:hypothetical protein
MIQRIQTVYLLVAVFLMALLFSNPIAEIIINNSLYLTLWHNKIISTNTEYTPHSIWPITILLSVILLIELIAIFLYKNRLFQIRLCVFNLLLIVGIVGLIYFYTKSTLSRRNKDCISLANSLSFDSNNS